MIQKLYTNIIEKWCKKASRQSVQCSKAK